MSISPDKIDEIISASDFVEIASGYVRLKKRGKSYVGLCPFHTEKTPSFTINPEKGLFYCFGCGKGGNLIKFVEDIEKLSFVDAVHFLADRAGIQIIRGGKGEAFEEENEKLFALMRFAGLYFYGNLTKSEEGKIALSYFHNRGLSDDTIRLFGLGYSMNLWDGLLESATKEGFNSEQLLKAGLVRTRDDSSVYDYFRGRAMFPIFTASGKVVGFGARKIREDDSVVGKYINSPETVIYSKSRILYGLFHSKESIRSTNKALMVEGYLDCISLFQSGIQNVVASSGTALTLEQLQLLSRYTKNLYLVYDADSAGSQAALRGVDLALEQDFDVRIVELPQGEDPDSFIHKFGAKEFRDLTDISVSFIDFKSRQYLQDGAFSRPETKVNAVRSIVQSIAKMNDPLKRAFYIKDVAAKYNLYESDLYRELDRWLKKEPTSRPNIEPSARVPVYHSNVSDVTPQQSVEIPTVEQNIIQLLLEGDAEIAQFIFHYVSLDEFSDQRVRMIADAILMQYEQEGRFDLNKLINSLESPSIIGLVTELSTNKYEPSKSWQSLKVNVAEGDAWQRARDAIIRIKENAVKREMEKNLKLLNEASLKGEDKSEYLQRHNGLLQLLKTIKSGDFLKHE